MLGEEAKNVMKSSQNFTSQRQEPIISLIGLGKKPQKSMAHQRELREHEEEGLQTTPGTDDEMWKCFQDDLFFKNREIPRHTRSRKRT